MGIPHGSEYLVGAPVPGINAAFGAINVDSGARFIAAIAVEETAPTG
jgi:hypothetical protein